MTTNTERAAEVIAGLVDHPETPDIVSQALADTGILAPDPVDPTVTDVPEWETPSDTNKAVSLEDGALRIWCHARKVSPAGARELAACLLSAAAYAEAHTTPKEGNQ